jgi:catechol 2,3-dioxygenase-like lactoylglutathione lyase family enzyme
MEQRISLVTLGVTDLARARSFYEALGWSNAQQPDDEICFFQTGGMVFGLWTALGGHGAPGIELA